MYRLVLDVASYPRFVPWCVGAQVHQESEVEQVATIEIARGPIKRSLTTCNRLCLDESIDMDLVDGPFRSLHGAWRFHQLDSAGCKVSLDMRFEMGGSLVHGAVGPLFKTIAGQMVDAFCGQAKKVYG